MCKKTRMRKHDMSNICVMKNKGRNNETPTFQCQKQQHTSRDLSHFDIYTKTVRLSLTRDDVEMLYHFEEDCDQQRRLKHLDHQLIVKKV